MTRDEIKSLALECGFSLKEQPDGNMDLHRYVYEFAEAMETFACKAALRPLRIENERLKTERNRSGVELRDQTGGYVYADQLLSAHLDQLRAEGWRQCAKGQGTSQFCGQLEEAVLAEREALPDLQPVIAWLENGCDPVQAAQELRMYDEAIRAKGKQ